MTITDMPININNQPAIYLASGDISTFSKDKLIHLPEKLGVCIPANDYVNINAVSHVENYQYLNNFKGMAFRYNPDGSEKDDIEIEVLEQPKHGAIIKDYVDDSGWVHTGYRYIPNFDYYDQDSPKSPLEPDQFVMEIKAGDTSVKLYYTISVEFGIPTYTRDEHGHRIDDLSRCPKQVWEISTVLPEGNVVFTSDSDKLIHEPEYPLISLLPEIDFADLSDHD